MINTRFSEWVSRFFDHPFIALSMVYIVMIFITGKFAWLDHAPVRKYVAARELVHNHRIEMVDLRLPRELSDHLGFYLDVKTSIEGKYVKATRPIAVDQPVSAGELAERPDMQVPNTVHVIVFPLPDLRIINLLDAGVSVALVGQDPDSKPDQKKDVAIDATVHALLCDAPSNAGAKNCAAILQVPKERSQFVTKNLTGLRLVLRSDPQLTVH